MASRANGPDDARPWWKGAVIYQIYPRSFADSNGDGIGDLPGITARLDHVARLGVDAIWISPFFLSPMADYGYDVADFRRVDPIFGTDADFDRLLHKAHGMGLKVVIDFVPAHTSDRHAWFEESRRDRSNPRADWYVWADAKPDGTAPNNWLSVFGGPAWQWDPRRRQYYLHHFLRSQPNLNWHNPEVVDAMLEEVRFWLDRGVDGLRLDAITTLLSDRALRDNPARGPSDPALEIAGSATNPFLCQVHVHDRDQPEALEIFQRLRALTDLYPDRYTMAEVADVDMAVVGAKYVRGQDRLHSFYTFHLTRDDLSVAHVAGVVQRIEQELGDGWTTYTLGNHDTPRLVSRWSALPHLDGDEAALSKLMIALVTCLRGGACLYQGDELALPEADLAFEDLRDPWGIEFWPVFKGRDGCRTPMPWLAEARHAGFTTGTPWLPVPDAHLPRAVDLQEADPASPLNATRRFLAWRRGHEALLTGDKRPIADREPVYAFARTLPGTEVLCAFNLSNAPATAEIGAGWEPLEGHGFEGAVPGGDGTLALPAFGAFFARRATR